MPYLLGIDIGTSGVKTVLYNEGGQALFSETASYPLHQPQNGWAEQDPADWWAAVCQTVSRVTGRVNARDIAGIGLSGQMHGLVLLDRDCEVLRPAILWCDQRTGAECRELTETVGADRLMDITANPALTGFTASKILWVKNHEPELFARGAHILLPKDYIRYRLTGVFATDMSDASGMQLLHVRERRWSEEVCAKIGLDMDLLPTLYESPEITGTVHDKAAALTGLAPGTPVAAGAGDNAAAAVGTGVVRDGESFTTIGTSGVVYAHTSSMALDPGGRVHTFCCAVPGQWHVMGVTQAAGLSLQWFRNQFCMAEVETASAMEVSPYALLDKQASLSPIGANRLLYLPYLMGERTPHLDPNCRGAFLGLSALHTKRDLLRAVMEGVSFSLRDCAEVLREMSVPLSGTRVCGGGGQSPLWRQMLADILNLPVTSFDSGPSLGVALLAGVGAGLYKSVPEACDRTVKAIDTQTPIADNAALYEQVYAVYRSAYPPLKDVFARLSVLP